MGNSEQGEADAYLVPPAEGNDTRVGFVVLVGLHMREEALREGEIDEGPALQIMMTV